MAEQFLEHNLKGREYMKDIKESELKEKTQIGEGAAAIVYKAKFRFTDVAVKKLKT